VSRIVRYALAGGLLALGAPAGLLLTRARSKRLSFDTFADELRAEYSIYLYSGAATFAAFAIFGGVLGRQADRLAELATIDPLTGLANRRVFRERLHMDLARAERYDEPLSVLLLDVDGLKRVNDRSGHQAGDSALLTVADAIRGGLREADLAARLGGDEFVVLAPRTDESAALVLAERLRAQIAQTNGGGWGRRRTTISIGVASLHPRTRRPAENLLAAADEAMYRAKRMGGNRVAAAD
jgi:diguanylate cyclase (GGDEF)-like protein